MTPPQGELRLVQLRAKKLGILTGVSNELIADGVSFEEQLGKAIVKVTSPPSSVAVRFRVRPGVQATLAAAERVGKMVGTLYAKQYESVRLANFVGPRQVVDPTLSANPSSLRSLEAYRVSRRPHFLGGWGPMGRPSRFSPEVRERAVRLVMEQRPAHPSE